MLIVEWRLNWEKHKTYLKRITRAQQPGGKKKSKHNVIHTHAHSSLQLLSFYFMKYFMNDRSITKKTRCRCISPSCITKKDFYVKYWNICFAFRVLLCYLVVRCFCHRYNIFVAETWCNYMLRQQFHMSIGVSTCKYVNKWEIMLSHLTVCRSSFFQILLDAIMFPA